MRSWRPPQAGAQAEAQLEQELILGLKPRRLTLLCRDDPCRSRASHDVGAEGGT